MTKASTGSRLVVAAVNRPGIGKGRKGKGKNFMQGKPAALAAAALASQPLASVTPGPVAGPSRVVAAAKRREANLATRPTQTNSNEQRSTPSTQSQSVVIPVGTSQQQQQHQQQQSSGLAQLSISLLKPPQQQEIPGSSQQAFQQQPSAASQQQPSTPSQQQTSTASQQQRPGGQQPTSTTAIVQVVIPKRHSKSCGGCLVEYIDLIKPSFCLSFATTKDFHRLASLLLEKAATVLKACPEGSGQGENLYDMLTLFECDMEQQ